MLPRAFRDPSESSASVNCTASDELPGTFRVKRQKKIEINICFREASVNLPSQAASWMANQKYAYAILPRTFRVKRRKKHKNKLASVELPRTFRVKRHREPQTKRLCLRRTPAHFRVKRLLPLCVCLCSPPLSTAAGCHFIAKTILAYETLTRTLRTASAQIPRIFLMFPGCPQCRHDPPPSLPHFLIITIIITPHLLLQHSMSS